MQIVGQMKQFGPFRYLFPYVPPPLNYLIEHARSLPVNHPDRCAAFQAFERGVPRQSLHNSDQGGGPCQVGRAAVAPRVSRAPSTRTSTPSRPPTSPGTRRWPEMRDRCRIHDPEIDVSCCWRAVSAVVVLAAGCGGGESADPPTPKAAARAADPAAPSATASAALSSQDTPGPPNTPLPPQPAAEPPTPIVTRGRRPLPPPDRVQPRPSPTTPRLDLHDSQVVTSVGQMREHYGALARTVAETGSSQRTSSARRSCSTRRGRLAALDRHGHHIQRRLHGLDDEAARGTPSSRTALPSQRQNFKAYWEHGAKPENRVNWEGASLTLGGIRGWNELRAGDTTEAEGLRVVDDHTLEIEIESP